MRKYLRKCNSKYLEYLHSYIEMLLAERDLRAELKKHCF